ncbi:MAG: hypothetical protein AAFY36_15525 [Bacteroidota bacterium]
MKGIALLIFAATLGLISCEDDDMGISVPIYLPGDQENGFAIGQKNGVTWESSTFARKPTDAPVVSMTLNTFSEEGFRRENISLNEIPLEVGNYTISGAFNSFNDGFVGSFYSTNRDDGNLPEDFYLFNESGISSSITISRYDSTSMTIEGILNVSFAIRDPKINPRNPDRVDFTSVEFSCKIIP